MAEPLPGRMLAAENCSADRDFLGLHEAYALAGQRFADACRRPEVLSQRLDWVKGQCALLAGYGIQGHTLANVLYKSSMLIMTPRINLSLRLKYLFTELGCTPEVSLHAPPAAVTAQLRVHGFLKCT